MNGRDTNTGEDMDSSRPPFWDSSAWCPRDEHSGLGLRIPNPTAVSATVARTRALQPRPSRGLIGPRF